MLQGLGAVASVLLGVVIARRLGPDGSGVVAGYRNIGDLFSMIGVLGLPQAFVFFMTGHGLSPRALARFAAGFVAAVAGMLTAGLVVYASLAPAGPDWSLIWIFVGGLGIVVVLMARGILLGKAISISFDLVSISNSILALLACMAWPWPHSADFVRCIAMSYLLAGAWAIFMTVRSVAMTPLEPGSRARVRVADVIGMIRYGVWAWLPQVLGMATVFVTYRTFGFSNGRDEGIGLFSSALVVYNLVQGPLGLFVPALMRHWSGRQSGDGSVAREYGLAAGIGNLFLVSMYIVYLIIGKTMIAVVFGVAFERAWGAIAWLLLAAIASYHCRLMSSVLYAHGRPRSVAQGYIIRIVVVGLACPVLYALRLDAVYATVFMAAAWAAADWASCISMAISTRQATSISWREITGIRLRRSTRAN